MSSSREHASDKMHLRRGAKKGNSFKENHVLIGAESTRKSQRRKRTERHVAVDLPEFRLLVKLYVPANLLIKNNQVSMKQLTTYLPVLVDERYPELNFELHIFLGSLVTKYVLSWYCEKLNTENMVFVHDVYELLCVFVKDASSRILAVVELERLLDLINQLAAILDRHLRDNFQEHGVPKFAQDIIHRHAHSILEDTDLSSLRQQYLSESHIMFRKDQSSSTHGDNNLDQSPLRLSDRNITGFPAQQTYLRILVRNILRTTFKSSQLGQRPQSSVIISNFLTVLVADFVLERLLTKLSAPDFLISKLIGGAVENLQRKSANKKNSEHTDSMRPFGEQIHYFYCKASENFNLALSAFHLYFFALKSSVAIFSSPVISLLDAITDFRGKNPVLASMMHLTRSIIFSIGDLGSRAESFVGTLLLEKTRSLPLLEDSSLAHLIENLRYSLFEKANESNPIVNEPKSVTEVRDNIYTLLRGQFDRKFLHNILSPWSGDIDEREPDLKEGIESVLRIFHLADLSESSESNNEMNLLLVIKLIDCIVVCIYPELASEM